MHSRAESAESSGRSCAANYNCCMQLVRSARDAGAGSSSAPFDETLPFPPPLHRGLRAVEPHSGASGGEQRGLSLEQRTEASLARVRSEQEQPALALAPASQTPGQASLTGQVTAGRLHWRGRELSPEFHEYALRVSRGENLAPFRGRLLADESQPLPWESADARPLRSKRPRVIGLLLLAVALLAIVTGSLMSQEEASAWHQAALSPLVTAPPVVAPLQPVAPPVVAPLQPVLEHAPLSFAQPASSEVRPLPLASEVAPVAPAPPPPVPRQPQPRKPSAPVSAAAHDEPSTSVLLVEKPPF